MNEITRTNLEKEREELNTFLIWLIKIGLAPEGLNTKEIIKLYTGGD